MTTSHSRAGFRRGSLIALPLLLVALLMSACSSPGGSPSAGSAGGSGATAPVASTAVEVGGHAGRVLDQDVQVVVGDAAIDVFGLGTVNVEGETALAAAFPQKLG